MWCTYMIRLIMNQLPNFSAFRENVSIEDNLEMCGYTCVCVCLHFFLTVSYQQEDLEECLYAQS